jgi:hypothetical protein
MGEFRTQVDDTGHRKSPEHGSRIPARTVRPGKALHFNRFSKFITFEKVFVEHFLQSTIRLKLKTPHSIHQLQRKENVQGQGRAYVGTSLIKLWRYS